MTVDRSKLDGQAEHAFPCTVQETWTLNNRNESLVATLNLKANSIVVSGTNRVAQTSRSRQGFIKLSLL